MNVLFQPPHQDQKLLILATHLHVELMHNVENATMRLLVLVYLAYLAIPTLNVSQNVPSTKNVLPIQPVLTRSVLTLVLAFVVYTLPVQSQIIIPYANVIQAMRAILSPPAAAKQHRRLQLPKLLIPAILPHADQMLCATIANEPPLVNVSQNILVIHMWPVGLNVWSTRIVRRISPASGCTVWILVLAFVASMPNAM